MSQDVHDDHPAFLQHHFDTPQQQFSAGKLGMWLFLAQEVLFFGGLFCFYAVFRFNHPEVFDYAHKFLDWKLGGLNTIILLVSSLTMALGVSAAQRSDRKQLLVMLVLTFACATGFMVIKYVEYSHKAHVGIHFGKQFKYGWFAEAEVDQRRVPPSVADAGREAPPDAPPPGAGEVARSTIPMAPQVHAGLDLKRIPGSGVADTVPPSADDPHPLDLPPGVRPRNVHVFFSIYYCLTGLHGIHVLAGMIMLVWLFVGAFAGKYNKDYFTPVDLGGLYWHLVDLVWIYLFPLLYLIS